MADLNSLTSELRVVRGCLTGDGESVRTFVGHFREAVYRVSFRILRHHEDAEDVVQETFVRAIRSLHQWDQTRPLRPWLLTIAANRCRTALAKRSRSPIVTSQDFAESACDVSPALEERAELAEELDLQLQALKPDLQECFRLFYTEQLSCAEIATRMNRPEGTIKTWLHRARGQLAQALQRRGHG